jgi:hypothetical protein
LAPTILWPSVVKSSKLMLGRTAVRPCISGLSVYAASLSSSVATVSAETETSQHAHAVPLSLAFSITIVDTRRAMEAEQATQNCLPRLIGITFLGSSKWSIRSAQCCISFVREPISASGPCFL